MLVWKGGGILVPLIYLLLTTAVREGLGAAGTNDNWALAAGVMISALTVWIVGRKMNDPEKARRVIDVESGQELLLKDTHTFFWIKAEYWALLVPVALGIILVVNR